MPNFNTGLTQTQLMNALNGGLNAASSENLLAEQAARQHEDDIIVAALSEIIDSSGIKNLIPYGDESGSGEQSTDIRFNIPRGEYVLSFGSLTSTDTDAETCQVAAFSATNQAVSSYIQFSRGNNVNSAFNLTGDAAFIRVYASSNTSRGTGDTVTFSNAMLCKKAYWDISDAYVAPNNS